MKLPSTAGAVNAVSEGGSTKKLELKEERNKDHDSDEEDKFFDAPEISSLDMITLQSFIPADEVHVSKISESSSEDDQRPPLTQDKMMLVSIGRVCGCVCMDMVGGGDSSSTSINIHTCIWTNS